MKNTYLILVFLVLLACIAVPANALLLTTNTTASPGYTILIWTNVTGVSGNDTWSIPAGVTSADYLVVGSGAAGGSGAGSGGGGSGQFKNGTLTGLSGSLNVSIGPAGLSSGSGLKNGNGGGNTTFGSITSVGGSGGGGDTMTAIGNNGGSGGGASGFAATPRNGGNAINSSYGNNGGDTDGMMSGYTGSGGGGAGGEGGNNNGNIAGNGGPGQSSSISGSSHFYSGGGGGGGYQVGSAGTGGSSIGGAGGFTAVGNNAVANTGSGGGGAGGASGAGGNGSSGVVIVKYLIPIPPIASFTSNVASGYSPLPVQFNDTSAISITSWNWTFGAVNYSSLQNPSYTFSGAANYTVILSVTNATGTNSTTGYIHVSPSLVNLNSSIFFSPATTSQIGNSSVYTATSYVGNITTNITSIRGNITWNPLYFSVGNIRVNTTTPGNCTGASLASSVFGSGYALYNITNPAGFTAPNNATVDFDIAYINCTTPGTSVPFSYNTVSSNYYDVASSQFVTFGLNASMTAITGTFQIPIVDFSASTTTPTTGQAITFTDSSTNYPNAYLWNFGNGDTSTAKNPVYAYSAVGTYTVSETAYQSGNATITNTTTKTNYITVSASPPPAPIANFDSTPSTVTLTLPIQFNDTSLNTPTSWIWAFGDTTGSTLQNPAHTYTSIGTYTVTLTATNSQGSNAISKNVTVVAQAAPVAAFTYTPSSGQYPLAVSFTDTTSNLPTSWNWNFGDGNVSASRNPSHTFVSVGTFTVNLTAYNSAGNSSVTHNVTAQSLSGFNRQDLQMAKQYTLTVTFVDSLTNNPIPVVTVFDSNGYNTTTSTGIFSYSYPYSTIALSITSEGYNGRAVSYVMDSDQSHTVQLTLRSSSIVSQQSYPHYVTFHVKEGLGSAVPDVQIDVIGISTSTGNWDWVAQLLGLPLDEVPVQSTLMNQTTDSLGTATFYMLPTGKYNITFTKPGYSFTPWILVPQDDDYIKFADGTESSFYRNGVDELVAVNISVTSTLYNKTYAFLNMTYLDTTGHTTGGYIDVIEKNDADPWGAPITLARWPVTGNSFGNSTVVVHTVQVSGYVNANITHSDFGYIHRSYPFSFNSVPVEFLGFGYDISLIVAFGIMMFTVLMGGAAHSRQIVFVMAVEGWIFYAMHWFQSLIDRGVPEGNVILALTLVTILGIAANIEIRKKKEKY